jgi:hypothetical protein
MQLIEFLPLTGSERRRDSYYIKLTEWFQQDIRRLDYEWSSIAKSVGTNDYRIPKKYLQKYRELIVEWFSKYGQHSQFVGKVITTDNMTSSETSMQEYNALPTDSEQIKSLEQYCESHGIPYEYVTSAKFINHNGQAAWNVVCDTTKISHTQIEKYFDKLLESVTANVKPVYFAKQQIDIPVAYHFYHSDKHVGAKTKDNSIYENEWNAEVFRERLFATLDDYVLSANMFKRFDKVLIADLGDCVDGFNGKTTRGGHALPQNMSNKETFDVYVDVMCRFIDALIELDLSNSYEFIAMSNDNHGGDFSYIVNRAVAIYCNAKYPQIVTSVREKFIDNYFYGNHAFMLTHGKDEIDMKFGWPLYLDQKTESMIDSLIDEYRLHDKWVHVIKGDLHQHAVSHGKRCRYKNVLSLYGFSSWSMLNHGKTKPGSCSEIVFRDINKIIPLQVTFDTKKTAI